MTAAASGSPQLERRLGTLDAATIGVGSMVGAGVFAVLAPAAAAAGPWLLVGLAIAALIAFANATSSAQLAAVHPTSGGTYAYGRAELGEWWGYAAGWCFLVGKTASCAAMALTASAYLTGGGAWLKPVAVALVVALVAVNCRGITRTALLTRIIVAFVLLVLAVVVVAALTGPAAPAPAAAPVDAWGVLQSAGLLFFAFAGYARIATMGEEVRRPERTIPRAILIALGVALAVYLVVALSVLRTSPLDAIARAAMPLTLPAAAHGWGWAEVLIRIGGGVAASGALLALIAGVGRTALAMARERDLPHALSAIHPVFKVPHRAEMLQAGIVIVLILATDLRGAIGFSSFGVLLYYAIANASAWKQRDHRRYPRLLQLVGAAGCLLLAFTLPWTSVLGGAVMVAVGLALRPVWRRFG